jgi:hypothetical protein
MVPSREHRFALTIIQLNELRIFSPFPYPRVAHKATEFKSHALSNKMSHELNVVHRGSTQGSEFWSLESIKLFSVEIPLT